MAKRRRSVDEDTQVDIDKAQAQVEAMHKLEQALARATTRVVEPPRAPDPDQFVMCWSVHRGGFGVTQCLTASGQVWERVVRFDKTELNMIEGSWWEPLDMERRTP